MNEYLRRLNRVIDYIEKNLDKNLTLDELAEVSCFSRFHFNRTFSAIMGETLFQFIQRLRIEKAAVRLSHDRNSPITEIALDYGFGNSSSFSKRFKALFGQSPSQWQKKNSNDRGTKKTAGCLDRNSISVEIRDIAPMTVAYLRYIGSYAGDEALFVELFTRLYGLAEKACLVNLPETRFFSVYHDDPDITEEKKLRVSACLTIPEEADTGTDLNKMIVPGGKYAVGHFEIDATQYGEAWDFLYGEWLISSDYEPDDRLCFEMMSNDPSVHPEGKHIVDIYTPVRRIK